nr:baseplate J/gp47 family protein [Pseudomonadota bacterium]
MGVYNYQVSSGVIIPDTADTRREVEDEFRQIFGQDFIVDPETPEGQWIDAETTSRQSVARNNANLANQINPDLAGGGFLDAILSLTGSNRIGARRSTVNATVTGAASTVIPQGSRARTVEGDIFRTTSDVIIPSGGTLTDVAFESEQPGAIQAAANALNVIVENVLGWSTVTNPAAATLGIAEQSDNQARNTRRIQIGNQGRSLPEAVIARV